MIVYVVKPRIRIGEFYLFENKEDIIPSLRISYSKVNPIIEDLGTYITVKTDANITVIYDVVLEEINNEPVHL